MNGTHWKLAAGHSQLSKIFEAGDWQIYPASGPGPVAIVAGEERAALIVKAVNSHALLVDALKAVQAIIVEGALVGFDPLKGGDWAERLYLSQRMTGAALRLAEGEGVEG